MPHPHEQTFPDNTTFALYAGLPLSRIGDDCFAWDRPSGRPFDRNLFDSQSRPCNEAEFREAAEKWEVVQHRRALAKGLPVLLPKSFPEGTEFADYEDVPLTIFKKQATAWDRPGGRWFNGGTAFGRAAPCNEADFRRLVEQVNAEITNGNYSD